jgi:peptidoglycan/LPS O-acetylase OafA/YrhL
VHDAARPGKHPRRDFVPAVEAEMISNERPFKLGYLRSLDGLRGVLILMVLVCHGGLLPNGYGFVAVNAFFVLSGFLITCLLVLEYDQSNDISLRRFYLRRALRLLPALVTMLFVFMVIAYLTDSSTEVFQEMHQALWALFYSTNLAQILQAYPVGHAEPFAHTWSLSLEEQFYFVWPLLLLFLLRRNSRNSLLCWIMLGVYLSVGTRILLYLGTNLSGRLTRLGGGLDTRADSLLLGCLVGVLISSNLLPRSDGFVKTLNVLAIISSGGLIIMGVFNSYSSRMICIGWLLASVFATILITCLASISSGLPHRFFENPLLVYLGRISYGLYVWHFPILVFMQRLQLPWRNLMYLPPVFLVVLASYYLIERPCLRLKTRFAQVK